MDLNKKINKMTIDDIIEKMKEFKMSNDSIENFKSTNL